MKKARGFLSVIIAAILAGVAMAQPTAEAPTVITSDQMVFDYKKHVAEFTGNVVADDGTMIVKSDKMVVYFGETNQIQAIKADGNVQIHSEDKSGSSDSAVYRAKDGTVELKGNAKVNRGVESVSGKEIVVWLNEDRMVVKDGGRLIMNTDATPGATSAKRNSP